MIATRLFASGGPSVNGEAATIFVGADQPGTGPRAYLNFIVFDRDFGYMDAGFTPVGENSTVSSGPMDINNSVTIQKKGYLSVCL